MGNVIQFSDYMKRGNLVEKVMQGEGIRAPLAAYELQRELHKTGISRATVFQENDHYVVVTDLNLLWHFAWLISRIKKQCLQVLKKCNPGTKKVWIFRKIPSKRRLKKILKKINATNYEFT